MDSYSLADLVEITGAKRRSIQLWADARVIQAEHSTERAGTGVHRRFSRNEAIVACIIHPFATRQMAIGELLQLSQAVRMWMLMHAKPINQAIGGSGDTLLSVESWPEKGEMKHQVNIFSGDKPSIKIGNGRKPGAMCMAVRLETYLAKLE